MSQRTSSGHRRSRGFVIYRRSGRIPPQERSPLDWKPLLIEIAPNEYQIRGPSHEALMFTPLMHGLLRVEPGVRAEVLGHLAVLPSLLSLLFLILSVASSSWPFAAVVLAFDSVIYAFQAHRFNQVLSNVDVLLSSVTAD